MLKTAAEIREEMGRLADRMQAIVDLAKSENREFKPDEVAEIDKINGKGKKGDKDYVPGQLDKLEADLIRAESIESRTAQLSAQRGTRIRPQQDNGNLDAPVYDRITIPAQARYRHSSLKAFKGPKADEQAYVAGRFFLASLVGHEASRQWCRDNGIAIQNVMTGNDNSQGGYLVPTEIETTIVNLREQFGVIRKASKVTPMSGDKKNVPTRASGLTAYFGPVDSAAITASDKSFVNTQLVAKDLYTLTKVSNNLDDDAVISVGDDITAEIAQAFANKEDDSAFNGDGGDSYGHIRGILNAVAAGAIYTATGHATWASLTNDDILGALGQCAHYAGMMPAIYCSKQFWHQVLLRLLVAGGGNTIATLQSETGPNYLGYPVILTQVLPQSSAGATKCAVVGDLRLGTVFGNRRGISVATSTDRYFENDQLGIRGHERFDFVCHSTGTASTAGAVVVLKTG